MSVYSPYNAAHWAPKFAWADAISIADWYLAPFAPVVNKPVVYARTAIDVAAYNSSPLKVIDIAFGADSGVTTLIVFDVLYWLYPSDRIFNRPASMFWIVLPLVVAPSSLDTE